MSILGRVKIKADDLVYINYMEGKRRKRRERKITKLMILLLFYMIFYF
jgi:hypothetical protein